MPTGDDDPARRARLGAFLRDDLVDRLAAAGTIRSSPVEAAMRRIPRERFVPELPVESVYDDRAQLVKRRRGHTLSTISQPTMVAIMLEAAELRPGHRVLEIGTGTGYNAALLGEIVGGSGRVVSLDLEADLVERAATALAALGLDHVEVHVADGRTGWGAGAPYDVVMATASVRDEIPPAWRDQCGLRGRLLVPVEAERRLRVERRHHDRWELVGGSPASFIPLR